MSGSYYLPLWTDAYLGDTPHLTTVQHGAYLLILMAMWRNGGTLPNDDNRLSRTARLSSDKWAKVKPVIMPFFTIEGDVITQTRLKLELEKTAGLVEKKQLAGRKGGQAKALKYKAATMAPASDLSQQTAANQIQNLDPEKERKKTAIAVGNDDLPPPDRLAAAFGDPIEDLQPEEPKATSRPRRAPEDYAFSVGDFRILKTDLAAFEEAYQHIDVRSELMSASGWAIEKWGRSRWFSALKAWLRKQNEAARQANLDRRTRVEVEVAQAGKPAKSRFQL